MKNVCQKELGDGNKCELQKAAHVDCCDFHHSEPISNANKSALQVYANNSRERATLDLSNTSFNGYTFDKEFGELLKAQGKPVNFHKADFMNCEFREFKFPKGVDFSNCSFNQCTFSIVEFSGAEVDFGEASFLGPSSPFNYCVFEPSRYLNFKNATFRLKPVPFQECFMSCEKISFQDTLIESDRFFYQIPSERHPNP